MGAVGQIPGGGGGTPASSVVSETAYAVAPAVGIAGAYARQDHTHGTPALPTPAAIGAAATVHTHPATGGPPHVNTGLITSGPVTCAADAFTPLCPDLTIAAVAGDLLVLDLECLVNDAGASLVMDAATRVAGADGRWFSTGSSFNAYPGGVPNWYVPTGHGFSAPRGGRAYVVQAGDITAGTVTVRPYGRGDGGTRDVLRSVSWPFRARLTNIGPVAA